LRGEKPNPFIDPEGWKQFLPRAQGIRRKALWAVDAADEFRHFLADRIEQTDAKNWPAFRHRL
jgi:hypothetical protein